MGNIDNIDDFIRRIWLSYQKSLFSYSGLLNDLDDLIDQKERELMDLKYIRDRIREDRRRAQG